MERSRYGRRENVFGRRELSQPCTLYRPGSPLARLYPGDWRAVSADRWSPAPRPNPKEGGATRSRSSPGCRSEAVCPICLAAPATANRSASKHRHVDTWSRHPKRRAAAVQEPWSAASSLWHPSAVAKAQRDNQGAGARAREILWPLERPRFSGAPGLSPSSGLADAYLPAATSPGTTCAVGHGNPLTSEFRRRAAKPSTESARRSPLRRSSSLSASSRSCRGSVSQ